MKKAQYIIKAVPICGIITLTFSPETSLSWATGLSNLLGESNSSTLFEKNLYHKSVGVDIFEKLKEWKRVHFEKLFKKGKSIIYESLKRISFLTLLEFIEFVNMAKLVNGSD